jgi:sugar lactone lactonase YvrE
MIRTHTAAIASAERATLGEGPLWDAAAGRLHWIDIFGRRVTTADADGRTLEVRELDQLPGCLFLLPDRGLVAATDRGLLALGAAGDTPAAPVLTPFTPGGPDQRFNDGATDPRGRAFVGTASISGASGRCALYRLDRPEVGRPVLGRPVLGRPVLTGVSLSNGLGWSPDGGTFYYSDTPTGRVDAFDYDLDTGALGRRRPFVSLPSGSGMPDGLTVDADGGVWIAVYGGARVERYDPDGRLDAVVEFDIPNITSCAFGGPALDILFITTARVDQDDDFLAAHPHAGALFSAEVGRTGIAETPWEGLPALR